MYEQTARGKREALRVLRSEATGSDQASPRKPHPRRPHPEGDRPMSDEVQRRAKELLKRWGHRAGGIGGGIGLEQETVELLRLLAECIPPAAQPSPAAVVVDVDALVDVVVEQVWRKDNRKDVQAMVAAIRAYFTRQGLAPAGEQGGEGR
jgi:hypothetical protein